MGRQCPTSLVSPFLQFPRCLSYAKIELLSIQKRGAFMQHEVFISYHRNSSAELVEHIQAMPEILLKQSIHAKSSFWL